MAKLKKTRLSNFVQYLFFSASNFFMHIFDMLVTYLQSVEKIQWKL